MTGSALTDRIRRLEFTLPWPPHTAAAFLVEADEPLLVDAGHYREEARSELDEGLATLGYEPTDIEHVVTTHPHTDHVGQVPALLEAGATVSAPRRVCDQLRRDPVDLARGVRRTAHTVGLDDDGVDDQVDRAVTSLERSRELLPPDQVTREFEYDDPFTVAGLTFEPVHTPGHQVGHACFVVGDGDGAGSGDERVLFSGDALIEPFRAAALNVGLDRGAYDAVADFQAGYGRLDDVVGRVDRVYPGHGPTFDDAPAVLATTRERLAAMVDEVAATVDAVGPASPLAVTTERVGEVAYPAALLDTVGALGTLEAEGRVSYELVDGVRQYQTG